jgi:hypothetical protein
MPIQLGDVGSGYNLTAINANFQLIEQAWDEKLDRFVSQQGNQMSQDLDMNGHNLINAYIGTIALSNLATELDDAVASASASADAAAASEVEAAQDADDAEGFANDAETSANAAAASAASIIGITTLPVIAWVPGLINDNSSQRYLFEGVLYIAPSASVSNPITLGATPVGDSDWTDWSTPVYFFSYEEILVTPKSLIQLPDSFYDISDVYVGGLAQPTTSYTVDTNNSTITFVETLPVGTFVKVWTGRPRDSILTDYAQISDAALSVGVVTKVTTPFSGTEYRPNIAFTDAEISINGVVQIPGASYSYIIEEDTLDPNYEQITFNESVPVGSVLTGVLRNVT